jgi:hypothetical protein
LTLKSHFERDATITEIRGTQYLARRWWPWVNGQAPPHQFPRAIRKAAQHPAIIASASALIKIHQGIAVTAQHILGEPERWPVPGR